MASNAPNGPISVDEVSSLGQRWYVLIIMMLVYTISIADRYVLSTLLGPISDELNLSDTETAWLGLPLALFYVVMGIPLSWLCDRTNRRNLLAASVAVWSFMTAITGYTRGYFDLLLARVGVGFALGAPIGAWLGSDIAGLVSTVHGWRAAFFVLGVPGIILALIILVTIKEPKRGRLDLVQEDKAPTVMETLKFLWAQKSAVHAMTGSGLSAFWGWGLMWFTPLFLQRTYGMDEGEAGGMLGWIYLIGGIGASLLTAWVVARPTYTDPRKIARLLAVVTALATIPSFLAYYTRDLGLAQVMWWLFIPAIYFYIGPAFALCQNLAAPKMRSMAVAISLLVANVLNLIIAPAIVGGLSDFFDATGGGNADSLRLAQLILAPTGLWAAWHYWRAEKYIVEDQKRAIGYV